MNTDRYPSSPTTPIPLAPNTSNFIDSVHLKFLTNDDINDLKALCSDWFPIKYPDAWYKDVTNGSQFFSLAAVHEDKTVGVIVAEVRQRNKCHKEDTDILGYWYPFDTQLAYILILGAAKEYRRKGVASLLLDAFLKHIHSLEHDFCKAVYLHVLTTNANAVLFYERHNFKRHKLLTEYYAINGTRHDGYSYALYVNDGCPRWTLCDVVGKSVDYMSSFSLCQASRYILSSLWSIPNRLLLSRTSNTVRTVRRV
jgi:ribosomal protein S18 acetylase RimI-like enzyme